jgi:hypothetical protein
VRDLHRVHQVRLVPGRLVRDAKVKDLRHGRPSRLLRVVKAEVADLHHGQRNRFGHAKKAVVEESGKAGLRRPASEGPVRNRRASRGLVGRRSLAVSGSLAESARRVRAEAAGLEAGRSQSLGRRVRQSVERNLGQRVGSRVAKRPDRGRAHPSRAVRGSSCEA